jgi:carbon-monoxide dehydrogenase medium subunit
MKLPNFDYAAPSSVDDAVALLANSSGDARIIAGGQSLLPIMAFRLASPTLLIDIGKIPGLRDIRLDDGGLHVGALVRWCDIERNALVAEHLPILKEAVSHIAHYQVRNRGTVGGSLALADPAAEMPCIAVTCGATLTLAGAAGTRKVAAQDFILGGMETDLRPDEILVAVQFPRWPQSRRWSFKEFAKRRGDFALAGVAAYADLDDSNRVTRCAIGILGVGTHAQRLGEVEALLQGQELAPDLIARAAAAARAIVDPPDDIHAPRAYRKAITGTLVQRALDELCGPRKQARAA